ncbi:LytR/AlgR family response regulator transcription factor [Undibacterium griseum]|uniref:Response regulator transcription factor n=1 Tax=Undibacterium griseum TaxID=2762295 RepID=A0ABR6YID2_9BURK|nr:LytTR family DNA-binding domain-containing protein [Undibacterium griseum]MBC3883662.1 response regulator transcription factor [Undibacterium griseum]
MMTAVIAEDEDLPRKELRRMLEALWPELQIVAECEHGADALEAIHRHQPDVAFLDIRMPGMSGLDVAHAVKGRCHAVFTTAYDSYAMDAFAAGAIDYLLKPVAQPRLAEAIERLQARLASKQAAPDISQLMAELDKRIRGQAAERIRWISASVGDTIKMFPVEKILFFSSDEKYTRVVSAQDEAHVRKPLKELLDGLDHDQFWQIHRGTVVRADAIARAQRDDMGRYTVELHGSPEKLRVSQAYAWRFKPM